VPAREREPAGGRDRVAEARPRTLEGRLQDPGQELRADERDDDERRVAAAFASKKVGGCGRRQERKHECAPERRDARERCGRRGDEVRVQRVREPRVELHHRRAGGVRLSQERKREDRMHEGRERGCGEAESRQHLGDARTFG
jgi:hypothetical protein